MNDFRVYLNDVLLVDEPIGLEDFTETLTRDENLHGLTFTYENNLTFVGDGYKALNDLFLNSYCAEASCRIEQQCGGCGYETVVELLIKITDLDQNLTRCTCEAKATDSGYYGIIHNHAKTPVRLSSDKTLNGEDLTPCPSIDIDFVQPFVDGGGFLQFYPTARKGYDHKDVLEYVLSFLTDNRVTNVQSDYMDSLEWNTLPEAYAPTDEIGAMSFAFMSGYELRVGTGEPSTVNFFEIMRSLYALHNLFWQIDGATMRLEPYDFFFQDNELSLPSTLDIIRSTDTTKIYNKVVFGSAKSEDERFISPTYPTPENWSMPFVDIIAHGKQEFPLTGVCQTDVALDLTSDYVYDSNAIEKVLYDQFNLAAGDRPNQEYDNDVFYIQYAHNVTANTYLAVYDLMFLVPTSPIRGFTFNPYLWHRNVINRHNVQSDLNIYEADSDDNFQATATSPTAYVERFNTLVSYWPTSLIASTTLANIAFYFGRPSWPINEFWGGLFSNNATPCFPPESTCANPPINIPFNDDSTGTNFDPNNNWDTTDFWYTIPSTGVYGFEVGAIINKLVDLVSVTSAPDDYFPIDTINNANERILSWRFPEIRFYISVFDSGGTVISTTFIPSSGNEGATWEIPDLTPSSSLIPFGGTAANIVEEIVNLGYTIAQNTPQSWEDDFVTDNYSLVYAETGQRIRIRIAVVTGSHIKPLGDTIAARRVRYGLKAGSYIRTFYIRSGGGSFAPVNPLLHRSLNYDFTRPLTKEEWDAIADNASAGIQISPIETNLINTHVKTITRKITTGETTFQLMANRNQQFI